MLSRPDLLSAAFMTLCRLVSTPPTPGHACSASFLMYLNCCRLSLLLVVKRYKGLPEQYIAAYQVATLVKAQILEGDDGLRSGSQRRHFPSLGLIVHWLLAVALQPRIIYIYHSQQGVDVWGCTIVCLLRAVYKWPCVMSFYSGKKFGTPENSFLSSLPVRYLSKLLPFKNFVLKIRFATYCKFTVPCTVCQIFEVSTLIMLAFLMT